MKTAVITWSLLLIVKPLRILQKVHSRQDLSFMNKLTSWKWKIMDGLFAEKIKNLHINMYIT